MNACEIIGVTKSFSVKTSSSFFNPQYKKIDAVRDVTLSLPIGHCTAILGRNGAGKTTLIRLLTGIIPVSSGKIEVFGRDPWKKNKDHLRKIGLFSGGRSQLSPDLPAIDSLRLSPYIYCYSEDIFKVRLKLLLDALGIGDEVFQPPRHMSLGQRMRVELAFTLLHEPEIVFLDEPTIGLDIYTQRKVRDFLCWLLCNQKISIILTSHNLKDIEDCASKVAVINEGTLRFFGDIEKLKSDQDDHRVIFVFSKLDGAQKVSKMFGVEVSVEDNSICVVTSNVAQVVQKVLAFESEVEDIRIVEPSFEDLVLRVMQ